MATEGAASSGRLAGRIALITGASRGIGAAVARRFAGEGAHVVLAARTVGGLEELDDAIRARGGSATLVPLDLRDFGKIDETGGGPLPTLPAARHPGRQCRRTRQCSRRSPRFPPAIWAEVIDLNLTANWRLIRAMDPLLRAAPAGRAIFVTSGAARSTYAYWGPYAVSKAGLETLVRIYAAEIDKTTGAGKSARSRQGAHPAAQPRAFPGEDPKLVPLARERCRRVPRPRSARMRPQRRNRRRPRGIGGSRQDGPLLGRFGVRVFAELGHAHGVRPHESPADRLPFGT